MGGQHPQNVCLQPPPSTIIQRPEADRQDGKRDHGAVPNSTTQSSPVHEKPWIFWWQRNFPRGTEGIRGLNWRAEGLRAPPPRNGLVCLQPECEEGPSSSAAFYRQQRDAAPFVTRRKYNRKSPSRRPHRRVPYYPPSPKYRSGSTSEEEEADQILAAKGKYTDPTPTPIPRDEPANMEQEETGKEEDSPGYSTPQRQWG